MSPIISCINGLGDTDGVTLSQDMIDWLQENNEILKPFSKFLSVNGCSEQTQQEVMEDLLDLYDDYQIINELEDKALCVYNKLKDLSSGFKNAIKKFDGEFPVAHLKFDMGDIGVSRGRTIAPNSNPGSPNSPDFVITIRLNNNTTNSSVDYRPNLMTAKTIAHEVLHAELYRKLLSLANQGQLNFDDWTEEQQIEYATAVRDNFPGIYDYYRRHKNWQHQQMATHYRTILAGILQEFETGIPVPENQLPDQLYMDLSWEGLIYEFGNNAIYTWTNLPQTEKDRIEGVIEDYINDNNNETCID